MKELFVIYVPICREEARRLNVWDDYRDTIVYTVLDDVALKLAETVLPPAALTTYIINALRNRVRTEHRETVRERDSDEQSCAGAGGLKEAVFAETHSEYGIRVSNRAENASIASPRMVIQRLARALASELSQEDLALLIGSTRYIPLRKLADEMSISHGAARVRLSRLRQRLTKLAREYVDSLESADRREVMRFLRRAKVKAIQPNMTTDVSREKSDSSGDPK